MPERGRVLAPDQPCVSVVVNLDQAAAPQHDLRETRLQHDLRGGTQRTGPGVDRTERGGAPVERAAERLHLAGAAEQVERVRGPGFRDRTPGRGCRIGHVASDADARPMIRRDR